MHPRSRWHSTRGWSETHIRLSLPCLTLSKDFPSRLEKKARVLTGPCKALHGLASGLLLRPRSLSLTTIKSHQFPSHPLAAKLPTSVDLCSWNMLPPDFPDSSDATSHSVHSRTCWRESAQPHHDHRPQGWPWATQVPLRFPRPSTPPPSQMSTRPWSSVHLAPPPPPQLTSCLPARDNGQSGTTPSPLPCMLATQRHALPTMSLSCSTHLLLFFWTILLLISPIKMKQSSL